MAPLQNRCRTLPIKRQPKWYLIFLAICFLSTVAWPQLRSGTIVVISYSKQKVIVAADSRANFGDGRYEDSYCKITALSDKLVFAATGIVGDSSYLLPEDLRFGAIEEARKAVVGITLRPNPQDTSSVHTDAFFDAVGERWGSAMAERFRRAAPERLQDWLKIMSLENNRTSAPFVIGIFAGLGTYGQIMVMSVHVDYGRPQKDMRVPLAHYDLEWLDISELPEGMTITEAYGMPEIVQEINGGKTDFAKREMAALAELRQKTTPDEYDRLRAIRLVDLTIAFHPKHDFVGGKIDAAELLRGGKINWRQRKENCPAN